MRQIQIPGDTWHMTHHVFYAEIGRVLKLHAQSGQVTKVTFAFYWGTVGVVLGQIATFSVRQVRFSQHLQVSV